MSTVDLPPAEGQLHKQLRAASRKIEHLTELLRESEASSMRLSDQAKLLKEEIRRCVNILASFPVSHQVSVQVTRWEAWNKARCGEDVCPSVGWRETRRENKVSPTWNI